MTHEPGTAAAIGFLTAPQLLRDLLARKSTGQLVATQGATIKKVFFKSGSILYATSNLESDRLGDRLLALGMITREHFEESARLVLATGRKQGAVLVQIGALTPKDLFRGLIAQMRGIVVSLFDWDSGSWRFLDELPAQEIVSLRLHTASLVFEGLALIAADPRWDRVWNLQGLELRPAASAPFLIEELDIPKPAQRLFSLIKEGREPEKMVQLIDRDARETAALLYGLTLFGLVEARPRPTVRVVPAATPPAVPAAQPTQAELDAQIRLLREKVVSLAGKLKSLSFYQVLGQTPEANPETIKRSYIALAKEYHPDRFVRPEFSDLLETVTAIFMQINEAYSTLHNPTTRAEYDRAVLQSTIPPGRMQQPTDDVPLAQEQFAKGLSLLEAGDIWLGIEALRWAVKLAPQNPRYHTSLGAALMRTKKRLQEAEEHCKTAIVLDGNNPQHYVHLGQVYRTGHLFDKARKQFETALRLDPKHPEALKEMRELAGPPTEKGLFDRLRGK